MKADGKFGGRADCAPPIGIVETILADLTIATDTLDVAATLVAEHLDDDDAVAKVGIQITCALSCALTAISALQDDLVLA
jgi:hypothetical protein